MSEHVFWEWGRLVQILDVQFKIELLGGGWLNLMQSKITTNINFNRDGNFGSEQQNIRSISCLVTYFKLDANFNKFNSS